MKKNASSENIVLFKTITECSDAEAKSYLTRSSSLTEALNQFFTLKQANVSLSQPNRASTSSTTIANPNTVSASASTSQKKIIVNRASLPSLPASTTNTNTSSTTSTSVVSSVIVSQSPGEQIVVSRRAKGKKVKVKKEKKAKVKKETKRVLPNLKRNYMEMIEQSLKTNLSEEQKKKTWPKYLGSLQISCEVWLHLPDARPNDIQVGDAVTFKHREIEFRGTNARKNIPTYTIKGGSLYVDVYHNNKRVGIMKTAYEEIFVFLMQMDYVKLEGTVLTKPGLSTRNTRIIFNVRLDVFLTEMVIINPLNIMATQRGRKADTTTPGGEEEKKKEKEKKEEDKESDFFSLLGKNKTGKNDKNDKKKPQKKMEQLSEEEQKTHHICRYAKESLNKLFGYLRLKVTVPTVVQLKTTRTCPFNPLRRDKYGGYTHWLTNEPIIPCHDDEPVLITSDYPQYFSAQNQAVAPPLANKFDEIKEMEMDSDDSFDSYRAVRSSTAKKQSQIDYKKAEEENLAELEQRVLKKLTAENLAHNRRQSTVEIGMKKDSDSEDGMDEYNSDDEETKEAIRRSKTTDFYNPFSMMEEKKTDAQSQPEGQGDGVKSHLNDLFNLQNQNSNFFSLSEPPSTFKAELHVYQKQALTWMKYREGCLDNQRLYDKLNEEIRMMNDLFQEMVLIDGSKIFYNPFNGEITVEFPKIKPTRGGILADEMGLGKTIMTLALIHSNRREDNIDEKAEEEKKLEEEAEGKPKRGRKKVKKETGPIKAGTLIIVPVTVMSQWESEIYTHSNEGTMTVTQYYGTGRNKARLETYDVVLTTYGTLASEFAKNTGLFGYKWWRVIIDEGHYIKERTTGMAKACCGLDAEFRWCLSGTPVQNKIDDLFSIIKFLRVDTWGEYFLWNSYINKHTSNEEAYEVVRGILRPILLRRTKKSTYSDGRSILELPPKEIKTHEIAITPEERRIYEFLFNRGKNQFDQIVNGGTLQYEYAHVFELLMRLRQVCDHPSLVFSKTDMKTEGDLESAILKFLDKRQQSSLANPKNHKNGAVPRSNSNANARGNSHPNALPGIVRKEKPTEVHGLSTEFIQQTIKSLQNKELEPCVVCLDEILEPVVTKCCHVFCKECIAHVIEKLKSCPICRDNLTMEDITSVIVECKQENFNELLDTQQDGFKRSSKIKALFEHIAAIKARGEKCVVFSQFIGMLNLIERCLNDEKIKYRKIDGSKTLKERTRYIDEFKKDPEICIFMISLKAGAVGLNLTAANNVILVDPWWNPSVEDQAIERVHRIGQKNKVTVIRLICEKTIEARILDLHEKKRGIVNMTLQFNPEEQKKQNMDNMIYLMKNFDK